MSVSPADCLSQGGKPNHQQSISVEAVARTEMRPQPISDFLGRVICGDCIQIMESMPDASVDFVLTDPPYATRYRDRSGRTVANDDTTSWLKPAFQQIARVLKDDSFCVSFYGWHKVDAF